MDFTLRPATAADREWLWQTKTRCLRRYVEQTWGVWDEASQRARFDDMFDVSEIQVIVLAGGDAGFIAARHAPDEIRLFHIMIAAEFQNQGLGTAVLRELLAVAQVRGVPVRLQVLRVNPARRLYDRLGFAVIEETPTHNRMLWRPV